MAVSGTINVNLSALHTYTADGVDAEKKVVLSSSDNLPSAVVAVASGTCGTTAINVDFSEFRGADGELVSFIGYPPSMRIAFAASPLGMLTWDRNAGLSLTSRDNQIAITSMPISSGIPSPGNPMQVRVVQELLGPSTASYTVVMLKEA